MITFCKKLKQSLTKQSFIKTTDLLCLKGKLYKYHLTTTDIDNKILNNRNEFLLVLSVI